MSNRNFVLALATITSFGIIALAPSDATARTGGVGSNQGNLQNTKLVAKQSNLATARTQLSNKQTGTSGGQSNAGNKGTNFGGVKFGSGGNHQGTSTIILPNHTPGKVVPLHPVVGSVGWHRPHYGVEPIVVERPIYQPVQVVTERSTYRPAQVVAEHPTYQPRQTYPTRVAASKTTDRNCLTKEYMPDGSVLFQDVCTKESAIATPEDLKAQAEEAADAPTLK